MTVSFKYFSSFIVKLINMAKKLEKSLEIKDDILTIRSDYPIRVGFLPDIHAGETRAVCQSVFKYEDAGGLPMEYHANKAQLMLHKLWKRNIELFKKYGVQHIFVIGDAFSGSNYFEGGAFVFIDTDHQIELTANLLEEVYEGCDKNVDFFIWCGTKYHEMKLGQVDMHKKLTEELNSRGIPARYMHQISYVELYGGKDTKTGKERVRRLFIAHEAASALVYPATLMSRDINWCLQAKATGSTLPVDAIIRAHLHTWLHVDHSGIHAVQLPAWLGHVPYKATIKYFFKLQPTLGGAMMLMDNYGRLDFWGGSYPFGFTREEKIEFHKLCVTGCKLKPDKRLPLKYGVNEKRLS